MNSENLFHVICLANVCVQLEKIENELIRSPKPLGVNPLLLRPFFVGY